MYKIKRNGFTLVELMAVIIIISLIALLTFPNIINQIKKTKKSNNKMIEDVIIEQAKKYVSDNPDDFQDDDGYCLSIDTLVDNGYVNEQLVDINNNKDNDVIMMIKEDDFSYKIVNKNACDVSEYQNIFVDNEGKKYERVEYLESIGSQYIDTGVKPNQNTIFEIKAKRLNSNISNPALFGVATPFFSIATSSNNLYYAFNNVGTGEISTTFDIDETAVFRNEKEKIYKNNTLVKTLVSQENFQSNLNIVLFGRNTNNGVERLGNFRIFYFKLFDNDELIRNYIPVVDENEIPCLFDDVEKKCYYNQGTGSFSYNILENSKYIESTGTQYIDTGVKPNHNTTFEIKVMRLNSSISDPALFGVATPFLSLATSNANLYYAFNNVGTGEISSTFDINEIAVFRNEKEKIYKNNTLVKTLTSQENFQSNLNIVLFGRNTNNGVERLGNFRIFYFKLFDNGKLVRYYIPYLGNGRPCLFDKVEKKCYYNQGTGEFLYGEY